MTPRMPRGACAALGLLGIGVALTACEVRRSGGTDRASSARYAAPAGATAPVTFRVPSDAEIPDRELRAAARSGRELLRNTRDSLPGNVGAALACVSCHPRDGTQPNALPWVGVYARFPQYRSRSGAVITLEDRINDCFERSLNGRALPAASPAMRDIVAYMAALSRGVPVGRETKGQGMSALAPRTGSADRGASLFRAECARCHAPNGAGTAAGPPLWGPRSFNVGAGMARVRTAAAFIRFNMPADRPGTLGDQDAFDLAAYIDSRPRPDFAGKALDWPRGDAPPDVAYPTRAGRHGASDAAPR